MCNKKLACLHCKKIFRHRISEHLENVQYDKPDVAKALALPSKSQERKLAFQKLNHKDSFLHNVDVLNGHSKGEIIVVRRSHSTINYTWQYLPCPTCLGFF